MSIYGGADGHRCRFNTPCRLVRADWGVFLVNLHYLQIRQMVVQLGESRHKQCFAVCEPECRSDVGAGEGLSSVVYAGEVRA